MENEYNSEIKGEPKCWNKRLMFITTRLVNDAHAGWRKDRTTILQKHTGNTIKHQTMTIDQATNKIHYGSHHRKCYACRDKNPKDIQQNKTSFKRNVMERITIEV